MNKKNMMREFINIINNRKLMTDFIKNIFDYDNFNDYNYLFRMIEEDNGIIIDIYDNVSDNRFNRYIFSFLMSDYDFKIIKDGNVFINYINVLNVLNCDNKLIKLAYLFKIDNNEMIGYANTFLNDVFVNILKDIIK